MSETTRFLHPRAFTFCESEAPVPPDAFMDYVSLTLTEAMAIWWNLEEVSFNTSVGFVALPTDAGNEPSDKIGGSVVAADTFTIGTPISAVIPSQRVCFSFENFFTQCPLVVYSERSGDPFLNFIISFQLAYDEAAEEWRLYYYFDFSSPGDEVEIVNDSNTFPADNPTWTLLDSGTFDVFGKTLPWEAYKSPTSSATSASVAGSTAYFTYPAP
jgi:hypothetical protein